MDTQLSAPSTTLRPSSASSRQTSAQRLAAWLRANTTPEQRRRLLEEYGRLPPALTFRGAALALQSLRGPEIVISGPSETGKTFAALWYADAFLRRFSGAQGAMVRKVRKTLVPTVLQTYLRIQRLHAQPAVAFGGSNPEWYDYPNGSRLWLGGMDDPGKVLSGERDLIYSNQAEELSENDYETLTTRATGRGAVAPYTVILSDCNPGPEDHWIIRRREAGALTFLESHHEDNPTLYDEAGALTEQGERTMAVLDALTGVRYQRLRLGRWVGAEGQFFTQLDEARHRLDLPGLPAGWDAWAALDYGFSHPLAFGVFGQAPDGRVVLLGAHRAHKWYVAQHAAAMDGLLGALGVQKRGLRVVAGHDCWATGRDEPETIADKFAAHGYYLERATISRVIGARAVGERLGNPEAGVRPTLFFSFLHGGRAVFDGLARMVHSPRDAEDVLKVNADAEGRGGDDDYDMLRYGVMAAGGAAGWNPNDLAALGRPRPI